MKLYIYLLFVLPLFLPSLSYAGSYDVVVHLRSYHLKPSSDYGAKTPWNEANYGVGLKYTFDNNHSISVGEYKNSIYKKSNYVFYNIPLFNVNDSISINVNLGAITGYSYAVTPALLPELSIKMTETISFNIVIVPEVKNVTTSAISFYITF